MKIIASIAGAHQLSPPGVLVEDFQNSEKNHEDFRGSIEE